jgi:hypothetical protein
MRQGNVEDRAARVLELIQRLKEVREQRESLDGFWWATSKGEAEGREVAIQACDRMEAEILAELRNLGMRETA